MGRSSVGLTARGLPLLLVVAVLGGAVACDEPRAEAPLPATGYFTVAERGGRFWLVTPEGERFYSVGVNVLHPQPYTDRETGRSPYRDTVDAAYESDEAWAAAQVDRLGAWGFNTVGAWSALDLVAQRMPYTLVLNLSGADWQSGLVPDYFDPAFEARCAEIAARDVAPRREDPLLVGWFLDNELRWGRDHRSSHTLLDDYLELPEGSPGRAMAEQYPGDPFGFLRVLADRYFEVTTAAVRRADPNHLILGIRAVSIMTHAEVVEAAAPYLDVMSVNFYEFEPYVEETLQGAYGPFVDAADTLREYHRLTGLPILVSEFSMRAADAGLPNSWPPIYPVYPDQGARADAFEAYVRALYEAPFIVGHHWFSFTDEPPGGRFDGEDSNFGLVSNDDVPWATLTERMTAVHAEAPHRR